MAKFNPIHGTLSGRLGGVIYAYNKGGFYVRSYVPQVWAGTNAQVIAKNNFNSFQTYWNTVTIQQRAAWQDFATNLFTPMNYNPNTQYTARSAAMALYLTVMNNISNSRHLYEKFGTYRPTINEWAQSARTDPPNYRLGSDIQDDAGNTLGYNFSSCAFFSNSYFIATLKLNKTINFPVIFRNLGQTEPMGIMFYCSNPINASKNYFISPLLFVIGTATPFSFPNHEHFSSTNTMNFQFNLDTLNITNYKVFPVAGDKIRITAYMFSQSGQKALIGSVDTIVLP